MKHFQAETTGCWAYTVLHSKSAEKFSLGDLKLLLRKKSVLSKAGP